MIERRLELVRSGGRGLSCTDPWEHVCDVGKMAPRWGIIQNGVVSDLGGKWQLSAAWGLGLDGEQVCRCCCLDGSSSWQWKSRMGGLLPVVTILRIAWL